MHITYLFILQFFTRLLEYYIFVSFSWYLADVEVFNTDTKQWRTINKMKKERWGPTLHLLNNKLTVFGGVGGEKSMEEFDGVNWVEITSTLKNDFTYGVSVVVPTALPN